MITALLVPGLSYRDSSGFSPAQKHVQIKISRSEVSSSCSSLCDVSALNGYFHY